MKSCEKDNTERIFFTIFGISPSTYSIKFNKKISSNDEQQVQVPQITNAKHKSSCIEKKKQI